MWNSPVPSWPPLLWGTENGAFQPEQKRIGVGREGGDAGGEGGVGRPQLEFVSFECLSTHDHQQKSIWYIGMTQAFLENLYQLVFAA